MRYINSWTADEDARLRELAAAGVGKYTCAQKLNRSTGAVEARAKILGVKLPPPEHRARGLHYAGWNDERVERAKELWREGFSAQQIADRLGGVSRNGVIGKLHRVGAADRPSHKSKHREKRRRKSIAKQPYYRPLGNPALRALYLAAANDVYVPPTEELHIPLAERKTVETLTEVSCRWPIGDPQHADFHFCGKTKVSGLPYCEFHAKRAFNPPTPRQLTEPRLPQDLVEPIVIGRQGQFASA